MLPLAWAWATLPTLTVVGAHLAGADIYQVRYLTFTVPAAALLVGLGLTTYSGRARALLAAGLVLAAVPGVVSHHLAGAKSAEDYRGLAALAEHWRADAVVFSGRREPGHRDQLSRALPRDRGRAPARVGGRHRARCSAATWLPGPCICEDVAGWRILQFQPAQATRDAYARRLTRLGCRVVAETGRGRYRATLLQC